MSRSNTHHTKGSMPATNPATRGTACALKDVEQRKSRKERKHREAAQQPIDIEALGKGAQVSARSLFRQCRKDRGYSPADFAKRIRLARAREMLEQSSGTSVIQIALKCGFQNPGHFARDFRIAFGELPSEVAKGARRRSRS